MRQSKKGRAAHRNPPNHFRICRILRIHRTSSRRMETVCTAKPAAAPMGRDFLRKPAALVRGAECRYP